MQNLYKNLGDKIFGQEHVINEVVDSIMISAAHIQNKEKPIGSFLFTGPTGTGKTELAKELAKTLKMDFLRFDMSEYSDKYSARNLTGGQKGLVGYEDGGLLTNEVLKYPNSVILFDEIEKADPIVYKVFLQILDYATLTDTKGNKVDFTNTIIIMTSNLGIEESKNSNTIGFYKESTEDTTSSINFSAIVDFFTPEMRARIEKILYFHPISEDTVIKIIDKFLSEFQTDLKKRQIDLTITDNAKYMLKRLWNTSQKEGARVISKIINSNFKHYIAKEMLFGKLKDGGDVIIDTKEKSFTFSISQTKYFSTALEAQNYAKKHIGTVITRADDGVGYKILRVDLTHFSIFATP